MAALIRAVPAIYYLEDRGRAEAGVEVAAVSAGEAVAPSELEVVS
ncbi:MAG: hypothetical protein ACP5JG_18690 [Anaerolineae bacterium]